MSECHLQDVPKQLYKKSAVITSELQVTIGLGMFQKLRHILKFSFKPPDGITFVLRCLENLPVITESQTGGEGDGTISWPPRSPDLTSLDFSVWRLVKDKVQVPTLSASLEEIRVRITKAVANIDVDTIRQIWDEIAYPRDIYRMTREDQIVQL